MGRKKRRLSPTPNTQRRLYTESGNRCSYPDCTKQLHQSGGEWIAQMAHIHDVHRHTSRYDSTMDDKQLRSYDNLILLCSIHHTVIDTAPFPTADELREMKARHLAWVREQLDRKGTLPADFLPYRKGIYIPQNMLQWSTWRGYEDHPDDEENRAAAAGWFVNDLEAIDHLSSHVAKVVALLARDGEQQDRDSLALSVQAAFERSGLHEHQFRRVVQDLENNNLGGVDDYTGLLELSSVEYESLHSEVSAMYKAGQLTHQNLETIYANRDLTIFDYTE